MAKSIDDRIAAALGQGARVADVNVLIADIKQDVAAANAEADGLDALSIAITTKEADAEIAADGASKARRRGTRLAAKVAGLQDRVKELEESNRRKVGEARYAAAKATRDDLAKELAEKWPKLTGEIVDLFERLEASDAECAKIGTSYGKEYLNSAESIARGCHPNFILPGIHQMIPRLTSTKLFALDASTSQAVTYGIWPKRVTGM